MNKYLIEHHVTVCAVILYKKEKLTILRIQVINLKPSEECFVELMFVPHFPFPGLAYRTRQTSSKQTGLLGKCSGQNPISEVQHQSGSFKVQGREYKSILPVNA